MSKKGLAVIIVVVAVFSGCDNAFHPFIQDKAPYSVYGYLEAGRDTNFVRVTELDNPLLADSTKKLHVNKVTLTNLTTGVRQVLQDSVVRFDSVYTHNFYTTLKIEIGTTYKLKVKGPDGKLVVSTTVPAPVNPTVLTNKKTYPYVKSRVLGEPPDSISCPLNVRISFKPVKTKSLFRTFYPVHPQPFFYCNRRAFGKQGHQLQKRVMDVCVYQPDGHITVGVHDYSTDIFQPVRPTKTLKLPGGAGFFGSFYTKMFTLHYDNKPDPIFNFLPPCPPPNPHGGTPYCLALRYGRTTICQNPKILL